MSTYYIFYLICFFALGLAAVGNSLNRHFGIFLCLLTMFLFAGLNPGKGTDYLNYEHIFYHAQELFEVRDAAFYAIMMVMQDLGFEFQEFLLITALLYFMCVAILARRLAHPILFVFLYLSGFYLYFQFNAMKQGLAILIFLVGISCASRFGKLISYFASALMHTSQAAIVLLDLVKGNKAALALVTIPIIWLVTNFYSPYFLSEIVETNKAIHPVLITKGLFCVWALRFRCSKFWVFMVVVSVIAVELGAVFVSRLVDAFVIIIIFQICSLHRSFRVGEKTVIAVTALIMLIGSLNIVHMDCAKEGVEWCNY